MEKISVTAAARHLAELLNRVAYQGSSFELASGGKSIAHLVPVGPSKGVKVADLNRLFARDIEKTRRNLPRQKKP